MDLFHRIAASKQPGWKSGWLMGGGWEKAGEKMGDKSGSGNEVKRPPRLPYFNFHAVISSFRISPVSPDCSIYSRLRLDFLLAVYMSRHTHQNPIILHIDHVKSATSQQELERLLSADGHQSSSVAQKVSLRDRLRGRKPSDDCSGCAAISSFITTPVEVLDIWEHGLGIDINEAPTVRYATILIVSLLATH